MGVMQPSGVGTFVPGVAWCSCSPQPPSKLLMQAGALVVRTSAPKPQAPSPPETPHLYCSVSVHGSAPRLQRLKSVGQLATHTLLA